MANDELVKYSTQSTCRYMYNVYTQLQDYNGM